MKSQELFVMVETSNVNLLPLESQHEGNRFTLLISTITKSSCDFMYRGLIFMLYEANDVHEAMTVHNRILISVNQFWQPRKQVRSVQIWKTVTTVMLWVLREMSM